MEKPLVASWSPRELALFDMSVEQMIKGLERGAERQVIEAAKLEQLKVVDELKVVLKKLRSFGGR